MNSASESESSVSQVPNENVFRHHDYVRSYFDSHSRLSFGFDFSDLLEIVFSSTDGNRGGRCIVRDASFARCLLLFLQ